MNKSFLVLVVAMSVSAQQFPNAVVNSQQIGKAGNAVTGRTAQSQQVSDSTLVLTNGTCSSNGSTLACNLAFQPNMFISIDNEIEQICSITTGASTTTLNLGIVGGPCPSTQGRGLDGSTISAHNGIKTISNNFVAANINNLTNELAVIENYTPRVVTDLGCTSTFANCVAVASALGWPLQISRVWTNVPSQTVNVDLQFTSSGSLQPGSGATIVIGKSILAPTAKKIFDNSLGGSITFTLGNTLSYPTWWGAKADGSTDDTSAIQSALDSCGSIGCTVLLPGNGGNSYKVTGSLNMYKSGVMTYNGERFCGTGPFGASISWQGSSAVDVIRMDGYTQTVCNLRIIGGSTTGWRDAIHYASGDLTTAGIIDHVFVDCNYNPGNGFALGREGVQGDQALLNKVYAINCIKGFGIEVLSTNAVDNVIINPSIVNNWLGIINGSTSTNLSVFGGSVDNNALNFLASGGGTTLFSGIRSEKSSRTYFDTTGVHSNAVTFSSVSIVSINTTRVATTTTAGIGCTIPLTFTDDNAANTKFTYGDFIVITGAGAASADLHTQIVGMTSTSNVTLNSLTGCVQTAVTNANVTLDSTVRQNQFEEHSSGPYVHINVENNLQGAVGGVSLAIGPQIFQGYSTTETLTSPFGLPSTTTCPTNVSWRGFNQNNLVNPVADYDSNSLKTVFFTAANTSANNAIVGTSSLWCTPTNTAEGTKVLLDTGTYTLQAGANTLKLNAGTWTLKSHRNPANNIATGYAAGSIIEVVAYPATSSWLDLSQ